MPAQLTLSTITNALDFSSIRIRNKNSEKNAKMGEARDGSEDWITDEETEYVHKATRKTSLQENMTVAISTCYFLDGLVILYSLAFLLFFPKLNHRYGWQSVTTGWDARVHLMDMVIYPLLPFHMEIRNRNIGFKVWSFSFCFGYALLFIVLHTVYASGDIYLSQFFWADLHRY